MPTATNTATATSTSSSDLVFSDGFETGNFSAWTSSTTDGGDLSVSSAAALNGNNGLQALLHDNIAIYVTDDHPVSEARYRARFYFDPNSIPMTSGNAHYIFYGYVGTTTVVLRVEFRFSTPNYQLRAALVNDATTWTSSSWFTITDAPHFVELDWKAATAAEANDGNLTLWIDGNQQANVTGVDNPGLAVQPSQRGITGGPVVSRGRNLCERNCADVCRRGRFGSHHCGDTDAGTVYALWRSNWFCLL